MADELYLMKGHLYSALWIKALHFSIQEKVKGGNQKTQEGLIPRGLFVFFCFPK